ncbi:unnamed protein product [Rotaria socialis]|uniref:Uncharacterized protein n=1 Tax=Rotaria socialis TaxID=392032 RepID=A0A818RDN1_9BILA|nr:unnamed protein product [Rotaria socialis]
MNSRRSKKHIIFFFEARRPISISNTTQTTNKTEYITSTSLPDIINTMDNTLSSAPAVVSTIDPDNLDPIQHVTTGCELGNVLYSNPNMLCLNAGYVSRVDSSSCRLYGFGVMGMNGGPVYARACAEALPRLFTMIGAPNCRAPENNTATENAVSAVTKILKYNNSCLDNLDENTLFKENLMFEFFFSVRYNPVIIGQDNANIPNVIKLFADAFAKSSIEVDSVVGQRMIPILRHVQTIPTIFQTCMNVLTNEERQALANALNAKTSPQNYQTGSSNHIMNHHASV